jgi:parallel beta-helix repeat protein
MLTTIRKVALTGVLATLAGAQAWAVTPIASCPFNISAPGNYVVTADLTCPAGIAINISASNVTVNLNGHIITGPAGINSIGIWVLPILPALRLDHVGISGPGLIRGFNSGAISIFESDYVQVTQTTVANSSLAVGIVATNVKYLTMAGNVIAGNNAGLSLALSTGAQVTGNQVVGNTGPGIVLGSGDSNVLTGNVVSGNSGSGIVLGSISANAPLTNSRVSSNTTNGNGISGIQVVSPLFPGSFGNEIFSNTQSVGNTVLDLEEDNTVPPCGTDFWSSNVFFTKTLLACVN